LNYRWDEDGSLVINGRLPAEVGAMLVKDVTAETRDEKICHIEVGHQVTAETSISCDLSIRSGTLDLSRWH
jgi:hypothetical protein